MDTFSQNEPTSPNSLPAWLASPRVVYSAWLNDQNYLPSTRTVYIAMFGRFCEWLASQGKRIDQCEMRDIESFLDARNPNLPLTRQAGQTSRQRQQYVLQLERVFEHLGQLGLQQVNPGRRAGYAGLGHGKDRPSRFLNALERAQLIEVTTNGLNNLLQNGSGVEAWVRYRDLALAALLLGTGLKVCHLLQLTLNCIDWEGEQLDLSAAGITHRPKMMPFALPVLKAWLSIQAARHPIPLPGTHPVLEAGREHGFGRDAKTSLLHPSGIHRRVQRLMLEAGISGERASAQTLRNTYAAMLIDGGASNQEIMVQLGLHVAETVSRLRAAWSREQAKQVSDALPDLAEQMPQEAQLDGDSELTSMR